MNPAVLREQEAYARLEEELARQRWLAGDDAGADTTSQVAAFIRLRGLFE